MLLAALALAFSRAAFAAGADPLPSWNDGAVKQAIVTFVQKVTQHGPGFVPSAERIATFDNDGTLWIEQPIYVELAFSLDRAREMAAHDPSLQRQPAFAAATSGDPKALAALSEKDLAGLMAMTHAGMTTDAFQTVARQWFAKARHPRFRRPYPSLTYQPQLELPFAFLRANGFKTFIVSGGGVEFMRAFAESAYGVPPEQVIGSSGKTRFELHGTDAVLVKPPEPNSVDDGPGKPENIDLHIGRRPILAVGNSDGDQAMLEYAAPARGRTWRCLSTTTMRPWEYAYDRASKIETLDKAWDEAVARGWVVVSMRRDWSAIFPPARPGSVRPGGASRCVPPDRFRGSPDGPPVSTMAS